MASKFGPGYKVKTVTYILISSLVLILGYEWMVKAFHLLDQPSDRAVYAGMAMLVLLAVFLPVGLWRLWRR
ncbi:MAG TPA: hypothetical protein VIM62_04345 [Acidobacteriaceae bacterium]